MKKNFVDSGTLLDSSVPSLKLQHRVNADRLRALSDGRAPTMQIDVA